jgi:hypothetical protein
MGRWGLIFTALLLAGCSPSAGKASSPPASSASSSSSTAALARVVGTVSLADPNGWESGGDLSVGAACHGTGGFSDINGGAQVVVSDDAGKTLAITSLRGGKLTSGFQCRFLFTVQVPGGLGFYGVTVTHRGTLKESEADLGNVSLTLGG